MLISERRKWGGILASPAPVANHMAKSYHDSEPVLALFLEAQQYYRQHGIPTKVKSCAFTTIDEILATAGVDAMTLPAEQLEELSSSTMTDYSRESLEARSVFHRAAQQPPPSVPRRSYIDDKTKFDRAFTVNGRGKAKTEDVSCFLHSFFYILVLQVFLLFRLSSFYLLYW